MGMYRFARYAMVGASTLLLDLGMLYIAVSILNIPYYIATPIAFLIAVSCNYILSRKIVFTGSARGWRMGYVYFSLVGILGALTTTGIMTILISSYGMYYLVARVIVAGIVGMINYLFNLYFNFKVVGRH